MSSQRRELGWGETPWDDMPRDDLVRETQRLFAACLDMRGALSLCKHASLDGSPFWGPDGIGGRALAMGEQATAPYRRTDKQREEIYRCFFRYAIDLLFDGLGRGWHVCDRDGTMVGSETRTGAEPRSCIDCGGPVRPIRWSDLAPKRSVE